MLVLSLEAKALKIHESICEQLRACGARAARYGAMSQTTGQCTAKPPAIVKKQALYRLMSYLKMFMALDRKSVV